MSFLIADDHELILMGISQVISKNFPDTKIFPVKSAEEAWKLLQSNTFEFLITDISMGNMSGIELCQKVRKGYPQIKIIVISQHKKVWMVKQLFSLNVEGLLLKEDACSEVIQAITAIQKREKYYTRSINEIILNHLTNNTAIEVHQISLTQREQEIIDLIAQEFTSKEISIKLYMSLKTVESHRKNLLIKFGVKNMVGLIKKAMELGFID